MAFLPQQNRRVSGEPLGDVEPILAEGRRVVVIGGGDTGSDCIGTSFRQGAASVVQLEIMPKPPEKEDKLLSWPHWPLKLRTSSSQAEGAGREFSVMTARFEGDENGRVKALHCLRVDAKLQPVEGSEFTIEADLVLLAMGFVSPMHEGMISSAGLELDGRGNLKANDRDYRTSGRRCSRRATCGAGNRSWSGRSGKAGKPPTPSTRSLWAGRICRDRRRSRARGWVACRTEWVLPSSCPSPPGRGDA